MVNDNDSSASDSKTPELLGHVFDRYATALELFARQWCDCPEDAVQEALIELAAQSPTPDDIAAWLYRVVRNKAITSWRSAQRRRRHEAEAVGNRPAVFERSAADRIDAGVVAAALESLSIELREVVVARIWGGLTFQQIGHLVGVSDTRPTGDTKRDCWPCGRN